MVTEYSGRTPADLEVWGRAMFSNHRSSAAIFCKRGRLVASDRRDTSHGNVGNVDAIVRDRDPLALVCPCMAGNGREKYECHH